MKKKIMILALVGIILTVGIISLAYAANGNKANPYNYRGTMMSMMGPGVKSGDNFNKMIELMKENGF